MPYNDNVLNYFLTVFVCLLGFSPIIHSQCESPQVEAVTPFAKSMMSIFDKLKSQEDTLLAFGQKLIVPGDRAGSYVLASTQSAIESLTKLESKPEKTNPEYEFLLPAGYIAERHFEKASGENIVFAFSGQKKELKEILVRDSSYRTSSGIEFGSTLDTVERLFPKGQKRTHDKTIYWIAEGISFAFENLKLTQIAIYKTSK